MSRLILAAGLPQRLKGLLLSHPNDAVLLLIPCRDIHTFGMRYAIDVAFLGPEGKVRAAYRDVLPRQRRKCRNATAVVERFARPGEEWFEEGDYLDVQAPACWIKED